MPKPINSAASALAYPPHRPPPRLAASPRRMSISAVSRPRASVDPGLTFAEVDDATLNGSHIRVLFAVLEANLRQVQPDGRRIGQEQVRSVPDSRLDAVLQEPVRDVHGWGEQFAVGPNGLGAHLAPLEPHLQ